jgi:hypothetical protein
VNQNDQAGSMQEAARRSVAQRSAPLPQAESIELFPAAMIRWLWAAVAAGGALGVIFARLLLTHTLTIRGFEGLYSMAPFTFHAFWFFAGGALGILAAAIRNLWPEPRRSKGGR